MIINDRAARRTLAGFGDPTIVGPVQEPDMTPITPTIGGSGIVPYSVSFSTAPASCPTGGDWNSWCDCKYPAALDPMNSAKCKSTPLGSILSFAPWTIAGRTIRGLPSSVLPGGIIPSGSTSPQAPVVSAPSSGIFGLPKEIAIIGGAVAVVGLLGVAISVKKSKRRAASALRPTQAPAMAGYRRKRR